jgi:hypothetical protein
MRSPASSRLVLFPIPLSLLAGGALAGQEPMDCLPSGVTVTVSPNPADQGEPVTVQLVNDSAFTLVLTSSCLFGQVLAGDCNGALVGAPYCLSVFTPIPPGTTYASTWTQTDIDGTQVPPGTYALPLDFPTDCCPTVTVRGTCFDPPVIYGFADQGTGGYFPTLEPAGLPVVGNPQFGFELSAGLGGALGVLLIGFGEAHIPVSWGTLLIDPEKPVLAVPVTLGGELGKGGAGSAFVGVPVPANPALANVEVWTQALFLDPASDGGLSHSWGIRARICP